MRNLGNIHHTFNIEYGKIYLTQLKGFLEDVHIFIPIGNFYYNHIIRNNGIFTCHERTETYSTLQLQLHTWFVYMNQFSHNMCLYEFDTEDELDKFLLAEKLKQ